MSAKSRTTQLVADQGRLCGMTGEARVGAIDTRDIAPVAGHTADQPCGPGHQLFRC